MFILNNSVSGMRAHNTWSMDNQKQRDQTLGQEVATLSNWSCKLCKKKMPFRFNLRTWKHGISTTHTPCSRQPHIGRQAKSQPARLPSQCHRTKGAATFQVGQILLKRREPKTWKREGEEMMSHRPKSPWTLPTCYADNNQCQNKTCRGVDPSRYLNTHLSAKILPWAATSIRPSPPSSLGIVQAFHITKGRPLTPPYLDHKYQDLTPTD